MKGLPSARSLATVCLLFGVCMLFVGMVNTTALENKAIATPTESLAIPASMKQEVNGSVLPDRMLAKAVNDDCECSPTCSCRTTPVSVSSQPVIVSERIVHQSNCPTVMSSVSSGCSGSTSVSYQTASSRPVQVVQSADSGGTVCVGGVCYEQPASYVSTSYGEVTEVPSYQSAAYSTQSAPASTRRVGFGLFRRFRR